MMKIQHSVLGMCATNTYYVYDDETKRGLIVDPADSPDTIIAKADSLSMIPEAILITHGHFDHVLAMNKVREHYGIKVYAGLTEKQVLHDMAMNLTSSFGMGQIFDADIYLKDGEEFETAGYHIKAIEVPGHTIGGMCYYFDKQGVLFSGDTLFCESVGRSDFPGGSASALCRGIKDKLFILPEHTKVYPGHMDETRIGNEFKYNPFWR